MTRGFTLLLALAMALPAFAQQVLYQGQAQTVKLGPFVDATDGVTPETGLTIEDSEIRLSANGGDFGDKNETTSATHDENGWYDVLLNATDTAAAGRLVMAVNESGALPVWQEFEVRAVGAIYVDDDAADDTGLGTVDDPVQTIGEAMSRVAPGGTITVLPGTYAEFVDIDVVGVTLQGTGSTTILTCDGGSGPGGVACVDVEADHVTVRDLTVITTGTYGVAIAGNGHDFVTVEDVYCDGDYDSITNAASNAFILRNFYAKGSFDSVAVSNADNVLIENGTIYTDGSAGVGAAARALYATNCNGIVRNCKIISSRTNAATAATYAVAIQNNAEDLARPLLLENCQLEASCTSGSATGDVACIAGNGASAMVNCTTVGGSMYSANSGSGREDNVYAPGEGSDVTLVGTYCDAAKLVGYVTKAQADLNTITGSDGVTLATSQSNYAPATATALATAQADLDIITGSDGVPLATSQPNYAPSTVAALAAVDAIVDAVLVDTDETIPAAIQAGALSWTATEKNQVLAALGLDADIDVPPALTWKIGRIDGRI